MSYLPRAKEFIKLDDQPYKSQFLSGFVDHCELFVEHVYYYLVEVESAAISKFGFYISTLITCVARS